MRIAICDDEAYYVNMLEQAACSGALEHAESRVTVFGSPSELAVAYEKKGARFDIIFLDLKKKGNGIEAARRIRELDNSVLIILITACMDFVLEGYEIKAFRYVPKPFLPEEIKKVLGTAVRELTSSDKKYTVHIKSNILTYDIDDIYYLESSKRQIILVTENTGVYFYAKLSEEEERLRPFGFVRVHQGFLVNMAHIKTIVDSNIYLMNHAVIPISKSRKRGTLMSYTKYLTEFKGI